jgi:hypothetical protein
MAVRPERFDAGWRDLQSSLSTAYAFGAAHFQIILAEFSCGRLPPGEDNALANEVFVQF